MKPKVFVLAGIATFVALAAGIAGFLLWERNSGGTLAVARRTGSIRIGYAVEAPYAYLAANGMVTGESPEVARIIAARLGIPSVEWRLVDFSRLIDGLEAGRFDVIAAGMFITPERMRRVAFSHPTFRTSPGLLVRSGNPRALHSYTDIVQNSDLRVAVLGGSVEESLLLRLGFPEECIVHVPDAVTGLATVGSGQTDALALSAPTLRWMVEHTRTGLVDVASPFEDATSTSAVPPSIGGFAFRKKDIALRSAWNAQLVEFIGSAEHQALVQRFGFTPEDVPRIVSPTTMRSKP